MMKQTTMINKTYTISTAQYENIKEHIKATGLYTNPSEFLRTAIRNYLCLFLSKLKQMEKEHNAK